MSPISNRVNAEFIWVDDDHFVAYVAVERQGTRTVGLHLISKQGATTQITTDSPYINAYCYPDVLQLADVCEFSAAKQSKNDRG